MEHGHPMSTVVAEVGFSRLPLSSTARDSISADGLPCAIQESLQVTEVSGSDIVVTGCHVVPPSVETSTPATTPPPASVAVPLMVTFDPSERLAPWAGDVIVDVGAVESAD